MKDVARVTLAKTDLTVFPLAFGSAKLGQKNTESEALELLDCYVSGGGNFIDSARVYYPHKGGEVFLSERIIGQWIKARGHRDDLVILTKGGHHDLRTGAARLDKVALIADVDGSLKSLQCDWIDLYCVHRDDPALPVEAIIEVLETCRKNGKIRYYGCSNWSAGRIDAANRYATKMGYAGFVSDQNMLCLGAGTRLQSKTDFATEGHCETYAKWDMSLTAYTSLAGGYFHKFAAGQDVSVNQFDSPENRKLAALICAVAEKSDLTISQVMLGFLQSLDMAVVPVVEPRTLGQMQDALNSVGISLPDEDMHELKLAGRLDHV